MLVLEIQNVSVYSGPLLFIIDEVPAFAPRAVHVTPPDLVPRAYAFDADLAKWFFGATNQWEAVAVPLHILREAMPPGVVSPKADRVAVWEPIMRAMKKSRGRIVEQEGPAFYTLLKPEDRFRTEHYLVTLDVGRKLFACDCPAYIGARASGDGNFTRRSRDEEVWRKRHVLCKHLMLCILELSDKLLTSSPLPQQEREAWEESKRKISRYPDYKEELAANYLYYFIKNVFSTLGMRPADYGGGTGAGAEKTKRDLEVIAT